MTPPSAWHGMARHYSVRYGSIGRRAAEKMLYSIATQVLYQPNPSVSCQMPRTQTSTAQDQGHIRCYQCTWYTSIGHGAKYGIRIPLGTDWGANCNLTSSAVQGARELVSTSTTAVLRKRAGRQTDACPVPSSLRVGWRARLASINPAIVQRSPDTSTYVYDARSMQYTCTGIKETRCSRYVSYVLAAGSFGVQWAYLQVGRSERYLAVSISTYRPRAQLPTYIGSLNRNIDEYPPGMLHDNLTTVLLHVLGKQAPRHHADHVAPVSDQAITAADIRRFTANA
ncbi:hypothetical protein LZ31DRAFT_579085 [Colletotrichum somersetense]|nr:hypothetical protein LZ31DRAFT_579085 [Colletotrichum somersetense]